MNTLPHYRFALLLSASMTLMNIVPIEANEVDKLEQKICSELKRENYEDIGKLLKHKVDRKIDLAKLQKLALENGSQPLLYAIDATRKISNDQASKRLNLSRRRLVHTTLFIETQLPKFIAEEKYYLPKEKTGLSYSLEYDPDTRRSFIVLDNKEAFLGKGKKKTVTKAIYYRRNRSNFVARAEQSIEMDRELAMMKKLSGKPGIFETLACSTHKKKKTKFRTVYSKLYNPGSMRALFESHVKLTLRERAKVACDVLQGLETIHSRGIVHCDLGARNYLVNIGKGSPDKRLISACIADFGRAVYVKNIKSHTPVQGPPSYIAPEGLNRKWLKKTDYYLTDIFALGCVMYELFYGQKASWQDSSYKHDLSKPLKVRHKTYLRRLESDTKPRRERLRKIEKEAQMTPKDQFEWLVLSMIDTNPKKRGTAISLHTKMEAILKQLSGEVEPQEIRLPTHAEKSSQKKQATSKN